MAETLGVRADRREPGVERHERVGCAGYRVDIARQEHRHDVADQPLGKFRVGGCRKRGVELRLGPRRVDIAPAVVRRRRKLRQELGGAHPVADRAGIVEQPLCAVHGWQRGARVCAADVVDVPTQDRGLKALRPNQVVGHQHEMAAVEPAVTGNRVGQLRP